MTEPVASSEVLKLIKKRFIIRADAKAIQDSNGDYRPATTGSGDSRALVPWSNDDIENHLLKNATFGHYLLSKTNEVKMFAFDIDLEDSGYLPSIPLDLSEWGAEDKLQAYLDSFQATNPRQAWRVRNHPARPYMKQQFREVANMFCKVLHEMRTPCAVAYSGNKGIHVYAFSDRMDAAEARVGAQICLNAVGNFELYKGENFYRNAKYANMSVEVFPKQDKLPEQAGIGGLGNLMRLPLGRNLKAPKDPTFFADMTAPMNELSPVDAAWALGEGANNIWKRPNE